jgi:hypothetical protein
MFGLDLGSTRVILVIYFCLYYLRGTNLAKFFPLGPGLSFRQWEFIYIIMDTIMFVGALSIPVPTTFAYKLYILGFGYLYISELLRRIDELD